MNEKEMIENYSRERPLYVSYTERLKDLISELLRLNGIKVHLIEARAKTIESFSEKIKRPGKSYQNPIDELPDLSGIRVIVYYQDDVEKVAGVLNNELEVVESEISHQPSKYSPDQFGYISLHYVVKLTPQRIKLPEWKVYKTFRSEIQIRTVLQHSWAAVSHALQYKHESDVPKQLRRKLFRLAGLFELADEEFVSVRDTTTEVRFNAVNALESGDNTILIDSVSLNEFILRWDRLGELREIMEEIGYDFNPSDDIPDDDYDEDYLGNIAFHCERIGIKTIDQLLKSIEGEFTSFLKKIYPDHKWYVSDSFVLYLILIRANIKQFTIEDLFETGWGEETAERVIKGANEDAQ